MTPSERENTIDYIELFAVDIAATKAFYSTVFNWTFVDYGPGYSSFADGRLTGGFTTDASGPSKGILLVLYASDLPSAMEKVRGAGGSIAKDIFSFPGGSRFHFTDPSGNELAVWAEG